MMLWLLLKLISKDLHRPIPEVFLKINSYSNCLPCVWLPLLKFELINQDSAGEKHFIALTSI